MTPINVMLDLETMGVGPHAAIISIGAVVFDRKANDSGMNFYVLGQRFYTVVDLASSIEAGGVVDASTILWWMKQSDAARKQFDLPGKPLREALDEFDAWLNDVAASFPSPQNLYIWGNGAGFDNVILESAYRAIGKKIPWKHYNNRCYRTIKALNPDIPIQRQGTYHNAVDDAVSQAQHLIDILGAQDD